MLYKLVKTEFPYPRIQCLIIALITENTQPQWFSRCYK